MRDKVGCLLREYSPVWVRGVLRWGDRECKKADVSRTYWAVEGGQKGEIGKKDVVVTMLLES
jgi:hypothetical protein